MRTIAKSTITGLLLLFLILSMGCASAPIYIPPSYPQPLISAADVVAQVAPYVAPEAVLKCEVLQSIEKKICRDTFLDAVILGTDANWMEYERELFDGAQKASQPSTLSKVLTVTAMGLGALGALSGGGLLPLVAAPYLASAAGVIPGVQSALTPTADPFFGRTLTTIDALMVASRAEIVEDILTCMDAPVEYCNIGRAVKLAGEYQRAGSMPGALSFASETAALKTATVKERIRVRMKGIK